MLEQFTEITPKRNVNKIIKGDNVKINDFVNLYGCEIGDNTTVGPFVEIQRGAIIGANCKIQSHSFICEGVTIANGVFIGHNVSFTNDLFPRATDAAGNMLMAGEWEMTETFVDEGASIGTGATILCGVSIGKNALVGAGAVVVKDVPDNAVVVGNPAKVVRFLY